jgi:hypothetical protein
MVEPKLRLVERTKMGAAPTLKQILKSDPELLAFFRYVARHGLRERAAYLLNEKMKRNRATLH